MRLICAVIIAASLWSSAARAAPPQAWRDGIDAILRDIRATHPDPWGKVGEASFQARADQLKLSMDQLSEEQRLVETMRWFALLGDGHSQAQPDSPAFGRWYPIRVYDFDDGLFITGAHKSAAELAGAQLLEIGGRPVREAADIARDLFNADNGFDRRERLYALHNAALMRGLGLTDRAGALPVRLKLKNGQTVRRVLQPVDGGPQSFDWIFRPEFMGAMGPPEDWVSAFEGASAADLRKRDDRRPLHLRDRRARFATAVPEAGAYYIQVNGVGGVQDGESFQQFFRRVLGEVDKVRPKSLILDMRQNFGGDGSTARAVIREFLARSTNPPWGHFYLLTGRRTFSAGINLTNALTTYLAPTLVGEPMGAPVNFFGDANPYRYPDIGMRAFVSHERHQGGNSNDRRPFVPVDVPARFTFADYAAGRDPAVDAILAGKEMRSIAAIAAADGADAALRVLESRRAMADPTWAAPTEIELRLVSWDLDNGGKRAQAIAVADLNTRINPTEWRTWFNLGNLHRSDGREAEAMAHYRTMLALNDPTNFNAERIRGELAAFDAKNREASPPAAD